MKEAYVEATLEGGTEIYRVDAPFNVALVALGRKGIKTPIATSQLTDARMKFDRTDSLNQFGSYNAEGFVYAKGAEGMLTRVSPLVEKRGLAKLAVEANRNNKYFTTKDKNLYDEKRAIAEADKDKSPSERGAIVLPSRDNFSVSVRKNAELGEFIFGENFGEYLRKFGLKEIIVYLVDSLEVDSKNGTLLTQAWLRRVGYYSNFVGFSRYLYYYDAVRGVRAPAGASGEASA